MFRLRKIKALKGYRFFEDFKWDENNCKLFERNNLIYGWNGSGKTTLCDIFKELEDGQSLDRDTKLSLFFEDTNNGSAKIITESNLGTVPYSFKVFHKDYVDMNITKVDSVKHIFAVGQEQKDKISELNKLKEDYKDAVVRSKFLETELNTNKAKFEQLKTTKASEIKNAANYPSSYNKNKFFYEYQQLKVPCLLSQQEYQDALSSIRTEEKASIPLPKIDFIKTTVKEYIRSILIQTPVNKTIEALIEDSKANNWVEVGLSLHEEQNAVTCIFCGNNISANRFDELRAHFNQSYKELSCKIDSAVQLLYTKIDQFESFIRMLPDAGLLYNELRDQYIQLVKKAEDICKKNTEVINEIIEILIQKKADMINEKYADDFDSIISKIIFDYKIFEEILVQIMKHNSKSSEFKKSIEIAQKKIEMHLITKYAPEIRASEQEISKKNEELSSCINNVSKVESKLKTLEQVVINSQIPAEAINNDIEFILGRDEIKFKNTSTGYQIIRKGKLAKNISKGEANAIALIYFFNALTDVSIDANKTIVILDDPISSFDSNFYYNAISYIRDKTNNVGQVFIFTHKFSLFKDYSLMYKGETNRYIIQRVNESPIIQNEDNLLAQYHDEYAYLFKKVYEFVQNPMNYKNDYLQFPNIARRLLEGYLTFKMPFPCNDCSLLEKVLKLEDGKNTAAGRSILRLLNNHSHLRTVSDGEISDDISYLSILPDILNNLLYFMRSHDEQHYNILASQCDENYNPNGDCVYFPIKVLRKIRLFDSAVSAGLGTILGEDVPYEEIEVENEDCSFAVKISGNSMEPDIPDQSIALVKECVEIQNARIGVVWHNGNSYCKKIVQGKEQVLLVSVNKEYKPIQVTKEDNFKIFGEVVDIIS